jgi:DNA-cytosine methyltransferase
MRYLSVCSGVEAASVAWHDLGWTPVGFSEIEPFPSAVLAHRFPSVKNYGDMTKYKEWPLKAGDIDLLVGGTPCQSYSVAGLRQGLNDPRGNLTLTFLGIVDHLRPEWVVWENVPGVLSDKTKAFHQFLDGLSELGYLVDFDICDAQFFGVPQRRRRIFVCARDLHSSLRRTTTTSASITAKLLLETLHGILEDPASTAFASVRSRLDSAALTSIGAQKRMQLLSRYGSDESVCRMLRENLDALSQLAKTESAHSSLETGVATEVRVPTQGDLFASSRTVRPSMNTEPSWPRFSDDLFAAMKSFTTSTPTRITTEQIISFCSHALSIAQRIARLRPSSRHFSEAASSALTFIERSTSYARLAGKDIQRGMEWVQYWRDFPRQAEGLVKPLRDLAEERDSEPLFPFAESLRGDSAKNGKKEQGAPRGAGKGAESGGRPFQMTAFGQYEDDDSGSTCKQRDYKDATDLVVQPVCVTGHRTHALTVSDGASEDGTGRGTPIVPAIAFHPTHLGDSLDPISSVEVTHALGTGSKGGCATAAVAMINMQGSKGNAVAQADEPSYTLNAMHGHDVHAVGVPVAEVTGTLSSRATADGGLGTDFDVAGGLQVVGTLGARASSGGGFSTDFEVAGGLQPTPTMAVRRLLPVECERLQGFPDDHTNIPWRGKPAPDSPRYKAMGNSMAVPVMRWIGQRLDRVAKGDR